MTMMEKLKPHIGHKLACACYGDPIVPQDICIECEDCNEVLISAEAEDEAAPKEGVNLNAEWPSLFECSVCGWSDSDTYTGDTSTYNFCPNCGATMKKEAENGN